MPRRDADYYAQKRIEHRVMRQAMARRDPENFKHGSDGRVTRIVVATATCQRCQQDFAYRMTTKPRKYCPACGPIIERERRVRADKARLEKRARETAPSPSSRLIPYVGYDPTERPIEEYADD